MRKVAMFPPGGPRLNLDLLGTRTFASGIVVLSRAPRRNNGKEPSDV